MCIFISKNTVTTISSSRYYCLYSDWVLSLYDNKIDLKEDIISITPVPSKEIVFLKNQNDWIKMYFKTINKMFTVNNDLSTDNQYNNPEIKPLFICHNANDIKKVDLSNYYIEDEHINYLNKQYKNFSFIISKITKGYGNYRYGYMYKNNNINEIFLSTKLINNKSDLYSSISDSWNYNLFISNCNQKFDSFEGFTDLRENQQSELLGDVVSESKDDLSKLTSDNIKFYKDFILKTITKLKLTGTNYNEDMQININNSNPLIQQQSGSVFESFDGKYNDLQPYNNMITNNYRDLSTKNKMTSKESYNKFISGNMSYIESNNESFIKNRIPDTKRVTDSNFINKKYNYDIDNDLTRNIQTTDKNNQMTSNIMDNNYNYTNTIQKSDNFNKSNEKKEDNLGKIYFQGKYY